MKSKTFIQILIAVFAMFFVVSCDTGAGAEDNVIEIISAKVIPDGGNDYEVALTLANYSGKDLAKLEIYIYVNYQDGTSERLESVLVNNFAEGVFENNKTFVVTPFYITLEGTVRNLLVDRIEGYVYSSDIDPEVISTYSGGSGELPIQN